MRLRVECTTEPLDLDQTPPHAVVAREVVRAADLDAVDASPFDNTAEGRSDAVLTAVATPLRSSIDAGAPRVPRVPVQVNVVEEGEA
ncbi:hypothetical protein [Streptomyces zagrosensis]|uniref:Uncharacterized protein n=1 Tax=Streptomyces zagrosensis TaxID=1042984 RepID=A0A7W9QBI0_9ACTN|nr:hypothetical protein [Streptomyces zagrosensis]MBB5936192.1 hypothetical protein [Streptomyces zagrosensis]